MHHEHTLFGDRYSNNISRNTQSKQSLTAGPDSGVRAYVTVPLEVEYNGREKTKTQNQLKWQMWYLECKLCINITSLVFNIGWLRGEHNVVHGESQSSQSCVDTTAVERGQGLWLLTVVIKASAKSKIKHAS